MKKKRSLFNDKGEPVLKPVNPATFSIPAEVIKQIKEEEKALETATKITHKVLSIEFTI